MKRSTNAFITLHKFVYWTCDRPTAASFLTLLNHFLTLLRSQINFLLYKVSQFHLSLTAGYFWFDHFWSFYVCVYCMQLISEGVILYWKSSKSEVLPLISYFALFLLPNLDVNGFFPFLSLFVWWYFIFFFNFSWLIPVNWVTCGSVSGRWIAINELYMLKLMVQKNALNCI